MNTSLSTGNAAPRPCFSTARAVISPTYPNWLWRCLKRSGGWGGEKLGKELSRLRPQAPAFLIGPVSSRLVTSHACAPRVKGGVAHQEEGGDKMAASMGHRYLRLLHGVTPWRNRYGAWDGCLGAGGGLGQAGVGRAESFLFREHTLRGGRVETEPPTFTSRSVAGVTAFT